ncbi:MAG TPA: Wzz/FepE/Etk N-terminal domain-containing protein [Pantanalinema sp.]
MKDRPPLDAALARFDNNLPLLRLLVERVLGGYPLGPRPMVLAGALALYQASLGWTEGEGSFQEAAERAIHPALMALFQAQAIPPMALPPELTPFAERLEEMVLALDRRGIQPGLMPYYAPMAQAAGYGLRPYEEFASPPQGANDARLWLTLSNILKRRWPLILSIVVASDLAVGVLSMRAPKTYKATTTINTGIASGQSVSGTAIDWFKAGALMGNLTEMLQSRSVLERTASKLNLATTPEKLAKRLDVEKVGQTDMMRISGTARSPQEAADLANTHTREFIRFYQQSQGTDARSADAFIAQQVKESAQRLRGAEDRLKAFKATNVPEAQTTIAVQLAELRAQKGEVERALTAARSGLSMVEREILLLKKDPAFASSVKDAPEVETAGDRLKTLKQNLSDARGLYGDESPVVKELKGQIARASSTVRSTSAKVAASDPARADVAGRRIALKVEVAQQQAKLSSLEAAIAELEPKARNASVTDVTYKELQREVALREADYQRLSERASQTRLAANGASVLPITIVDLAEPPIKPEDAKTLVKLALGSLIAGVFGFVLAYVLEARASALMAHELVEAKLDQEKGA